MLRTSALNAGARMAELEHFATSAKPQNKTKRCRKDSAEFSGEPCRIRTCDPLIKSLKRLVSADF